LPNERISETAYGQEVIAQGRLDDRTRTKLAAIYEEIMWLAKRTNVSPSDARAWYTHVRAGRISQSIRRFTGKVSENAARSKGKPLRLEHYMRIQTTLTSLVAKHLNAKKRNPREFVRIVWDYERVHIVTVAENYSAVRAKGNYRKAGIKLRAWRSLPLARRALLWRKMLRGRVANAAAFAPSKSHRSEPPDVGRREWLSDDGVTWQRIRGNRA
jgi:hypothetical protein